MCKLKIYKQTEKEELLTKYINTKDSKEKNKEQHRNLCAHLSTE